MNTRRFLLPSLLAVAAFQGTSYGALLKIGINFLGRDNETLGLLGSNDQAGVVPQADWNNMGNNIDSITGDWTNPAGSNFAGLTSSPLFTDNGIADGTRGTSAVTITLTAADAWHSDGGNANPNEKLMHGIVKAGNAQGNVPGGVGAVNTVTINHLDPNSHYELIAYGNVNNSNNDVKVDYALTGALTYASYYQLQPDNFNDVFIQGSNTTNSDASRTLANYVQWADVAATAAGTLNFSWIWRGGGDGAGLNGLQLIELPPVSTGDVWWNKGSGPNAWDTTSTNWATDAAGLNPNALFATSFTAHFTDLGTAGARVITVDAGGVTPGGLDVNNATGNDYTIGGGALLGAGGLTKNGNGVLNLTGTNQFSGATTLKHGTINVTTIGDPAGAGNLGQGTLINVGDTAGNNNAVLNYGGSTATVSRSMIVNGQGGTVNINTAGQTLTLVDLSGTGALTKGGGGALTFTGVISTHTGSITVSAGALTVNTIGSGTGNLLTLGAASSFNVTNPGIISDARTLFLLGSASVGVTSATGSYTMGGDFNDSGKTLTKTGNGRLELSGAAIFSQQPVISAGTLALTKDGAITLPAGTITLAANQRLEIATGGLTATTPVTINNGSLRVGHQGLEAYYFTGGFDQNAFTNAMNGSIYGIASYFAAQGNPAVTARTNTGGQTNLDFSNGAYGANAPFANQGLADADNIRVIFTGKIRIDSPGATTFFTTSDDGSGIFIDGTRVVLNNNFQGATTRQGTITLTAGLHDIEMYYAEGGGGAGVLAEYQPAGGVRQTISNSILLSGDQVDYSLAPITIQAGSTTSTIEAGAALATLGALSLPANTLLTINGSASFTGTALTGNAHQVAVTGFNSNSTLGPITGSATTLTKTGNGNLIFITAPPAGSTINSNAGLVVAMGSAGGGNPLATTTINFNGGGLGLSSIPSGGDVTYSNPITSTANFVLAAGSFGNGNISTATNVIYAGPALVAPTGQTLTLRSNDGNFTLNVTPPVTGTGAIVTEEGPVNLNGGVNNVGNNFTNRIASVTVNGNMVTNSLTQQGNLPNGTTGTNLGDALITGTLNPGFLTVTGTTNATAITTTRGTLSLNGNVINTGVLTGNGNGTMNLVNSTHASASLSANATLNSTGTLGITGALTVNGATANLTGAATVGSLVLSGASGTVKIGTTLTAGTIGGTGVTVNQAGNLNFDPGAGNTATLTGGDVSLDSKANVHVVSGIADLTAVTIHSNPQTITALSNTLGGRLTNLTTDGNVRLNPQDQNTANALFNNTTTPGIARTALLTGALDFNGDNAVATFFGFTNNGAAGNDVDRFNLAFTGRLTATANGPVSLGIFEQDDNAAFWLDFNQNGVFDSGELVAQSNCCQTTTDAATPSLVAGQTYNILISVEDTGGGGSLGGRIGGLTLNPSAQTGVFSYLQDNNAGSNFQIDSNTELRVKAFDGVTNIKEANNAILTLTNKATQISSSAARIQLTGSTGTVLLGDQNVLTLGEIIFTNGATLNIDLAPGAVNGGRLVINGVIPGFTGVHTNTNASAINVVGGSLIADTILDGSGGLINVSLSGTIGGTGAFNMTVNTSGSGTIAPGDPASNNGLGRLTIGDINSAGNFAVQLKNSGAGNFDQLSVVGFAFIDGTTLALSLDPAFAAAPGDKFPILLNDSTDSVVGQFAQGTAITVGVAQFSIHYDGDFDSSGAPNDIYLQYVIPEPGTVAIMLGGFATLLGLRRTRRRSA